MAVHFRPFPLDLFHGCALYQETSDNTSRLQICDDGAESNFVILLTLHSECMIIILPVSDVVVFGFLSSSTGCSMVHVWIGFYLWDVFQIVIKGFKRGTCQITDNQTTAEEVIKFSAQRMLALLVGSPRFLLPFCQLHNTMRGFASSTRIIILVHILRPEMRLPK